MSKTQGEKGLTKEENKYYIYKHSPGGIVRPVFTKRVCISTGEKKGTRATYEKIPKTGWLYKKVFTKVP
jgi:hypothetical protein